ncbi:RNAse P Rpr2/Rpp21/SNM1 subunit domain family protein [Acanthocheilonema viteae]|uniref:Uncharacterized protein n=1 Tax=Acanthocheilonema viteae TaxID=6277 RepID=A0A498SBQ8_ACAVI|nr:unnamed protein product [Acanthocheilonema viteae]
MMATNKVRVGSSFEIPSAANQHESNSFQRKKRRLHADQRAQLTYQKIIAERKAEKEKRLLEKEKRQKVLEEYTSIKRRMNKALSKKNRRGQPNLNAQIEVLLEKIKKREQSRNKVDGFMTDGKTRSLKPNEFHYRCNYLYGAASLLCSQSSGNIGLETLSKLYLREMKELCLVEMIRLEKDFGRTICKRCKNIFIARLDGTQSITVRLNKKKQMVRTCLSCGAKKRFLRNTKYLSRNEQDQYQKETAKQQKEVSAEAVHHTFPSSN